MAPELALAALTELPRDSLVLDPMAGSGTVLRAATSAGHKAIGVDTDPLALLISRVETSLLDPNAFRAACDLVLKKAQSIDAEDVALPWIDGDDETEKFVHYWFAEEQRRDLRRIVASLPAGGDPVADALRLALSRVIVTKEKGASLARDVSHSRPHRVRVENDFNVFDGFDRAVSYIIREVVKEPSHGVASVIRGDVRRLPIADSSVPMVITSPPYLNAIDYIRGHRLSLVWLGMTATELRSIRSENIGAERSPNSRWGLERSEQAFGSETHLLPARAARIVDRYWNDLLRMMAEIERVLALNGRACLVVGNSTLRGVFLDNSAACTEAAAQVGLRLVDVWRRPLPAMSRYLPPPGEQDRGLDRRLREEVVLTFIRKR